MDYEIKLLPIVQNDLRKAKKWYSDKNKALGPMLLLNIWETLKVMEQLELIIGIQQ